MDKTGRVQNMEENNKPKNEFIREQIKNKPVNKRKTIEKLGFSALCGVVFAVAAITVFAAATMIRRCLMGIRLR